MWVYIVCGIIWILSLITIIKERLACETYAHIGAVVFFTSLFFNLGGIWKFDIANILWLEIIGFLFFIPSAFLIISSWIAFNRGGKAKTSFLNPAQPTCFGWYRNTWDCPTSYLSWHSSLVICLNFSFSVNSFPNFGNNSNILFMDGI